jgi:apolipoprotein N-acyltransferase
MFKGKSMKSLRFSIISGILVATSYIPFPPWAIFFCLCPLWSILIKEENPKKIFLYSWLTPFIFTLIGFHWIPTTIVDFGHMPVIFGIIGLLAFAAFSNLHFPLAAIVWYKFNKKLQFSEGKSIFVLALLTAFFEKLNPQIFPWYFGYAWFFGDLPAYQLADTIGVTGLSSLTLIINAWILYIVINIRNRQLFRNQVTYFVLFFSLINLVGIYKKHEWKKTDAEIKALMVQPNIGNQEKQWDIYGPEFKSQTVQKHFDLTTPELVNRPDVVIWPETSIPEFMEPRFYGIKTVRAVLNFVKLNKINLFTGAFTEDIDTRKQSNAIFVFDPTGKNTGIYQKHILLAFGEYLPFSDYFPFMLKLLPTIADFERGVGPHILSIQSNNGENINLGPQICYEGLHPWFSKKLIDDGTDIFVNITNDSWFGHTFESYQHLYMTLMRSIEFRRPMIRVTNTGISSVITANGDVTEMSPQKKEWAKTVTVPYLKNAPKTIYARFLYFDYFAVILALIYLLRLYKLRGWNGKK